MPKLELHGGRLLVVSNRLPVSFTRDEDRSWKAIPGSGGLVTALLPVLRESGGVWIGWPGIPRRELDESRYALLRGTGDSLGFEVRPVFLSAADLRDFYRGFCNEVLWPIFHDLQYICRFEPPYWRRYRRVNRNFADAIRQEYQPGDYIWVHDYHLILAAQELRRLGLEAPTGFFLHIPFPQPDIFRKLPWRRELLEGMLNYAFLAFQTRRDQSNFLDCLRVMMPEAEIRRQGPGERIVSVHAGGRCIRTGHFPISIDFQEFAREAAGHRTAERAWLLHEKFPRRQIILGIDRLDYTKGIPHRLQAFREALKRYPELRGKVSLVQVVVPSRTRVPRYRALRTEIEQLVGAVNGEFTRAGWIPVHYMYRSLSRPELLSFYRASELALITPLKDGMNLIAKEYCACQVDEQGVLILSEFAGAADQLGPHSLLVNPYHREQVADAIHQAFHMDRGARRARMRMLRRLVQKEDVFWWVDGCLRAALDQLEPRRSLP